MTMWNYLNLQESFQCILIDLPGHGESPIDLNEKLSMRAIASAVIELMESMGIKSYDVVGHSMGGYVALEMKAIDPGCKKIVLLNSNFWEDSEMKKIDRERVAELVINKKEAFVQMAIPNLFMNPESKQEEVAQLITEAIGIDAHTIAISSIAMSKRNDNYELILEYSKSILIIQGKYDTIVLADKMKSLLEGTDVLVNELPSGHMAHIEYSELVNKSLREFLA